MKDKMGMGNLDNIASLEINTNRFNSIGIEFIVKTLEDLHVWEEDDSAQAVLITGNEKAFCTGANLQEITHYTEHECVHFFMMFDKLLLKIYSYPKPVVSLISGHALGGGLAISLASDFSIASLSPKARLGFPELKLGLRMTPIMADIISKNNQIDMYSVLVGNQLSVSEAYQAGFIKEICIENCAQRVTEILRELIDVPRHSFKFYRKVLRGYLSEGDSVYLKSQYKQLHQEIKEYAIAQKNKLC